MINFDFPNFLRNSSKVELYLFECFIRFEHSNNCFGCNEISGAFRLYDVDNDGFITRDEMYNIVDAIYQMVVSRETEIELHELYFFLNF